jgi:TPR repeat protein
MRRAFLLLLACAGVARADGGPNRICDDLADCQTKCTSKNGEACLKAGAYTLAQAPDDVAKARALYDRACRLKIGRGCMAFARSFEDAGDTKATKQVTAAYKKAAALLEPACTKKKIPAACTLLSGMYTEGKGVAKNEKKAEDYYQKSCVIKFGSPCPPSAPPEPAKTRPD